MTAFFEVKNSKTVTLQRASTLDLLKNEIQKPEKVLQRISKRQLL